MADTPTLDAARQRSVTVEKLIQYAGQFNEEIRDYGSRADETPHGREQSEYLRGQIDLIIDAAGLPMEDYVREEVEAAITKASDEFFNRTQA